MKRKKFALVAVSLALGVGAVAGAARSGLLGTLVVGGDGHPAASGIQVHGKWALVVRNRRGKVVARRRFENALTPTGQYDLAGLITGGTLTAFNGGQPGPAGAAPGVVGGQAVMLDDGTVPGSGRGCHVLPPPIPNPCIATHDDGDPSDSDRGGSGALHLSANGAALTFSTTVTPYATTTFVRVFTMLKMCTIDSYGGSYNIADCGSDAAGNPEGQSNVKMPGWFALTGKTLSTPLTVQSGQSVAVTVQLSFS